ncbi:MAG: hypothetical protein IT198_05995 [Acidimicrobiia bacterium]|nr:hypothetical protein [Acidimicrobiia bacterium]
MWDLCIALLATSMCGFWAWGVLDAAAPRGDADVTRWTWVCVCGIGGPAGALVWMVGPRRRLPALDRVDFRAPPEEADLATLPGLPEGVALPAA